MMLPFPPASPQEIPVHLLLTAAVSPASEKFYTAEK